MVSLLPPFAAAITLLWVSVGASALEPGAPGVDDVGSPARRVALGVARPDGRDLAELDAISTTLGGRAPAIWVIWSQWGSERTREFPTELADDLAERGVTPMIWWEPVDPTDFDDPTYTRFRTIIRGDHDEYIRRFAREARSFGEPVLLRLAHEANGSYHPWSIERHDNDAKRFVRAWRHVHDLFAVEGASNVRFVWSVAKQRCPGGCNPYEAVYPGDDYVDIVGFSTHNWGAHKDRWRSLYEGAEKVARHLSDLTGKPQMMAEIASNSDGGDKAAWIREGYPEIYSRLPAVTAIVYLDADLRRVGHPDWRLESPPEALAALAEIAAMPRFQPTASADPGGSLSRD